MKLLVLRCLAVSVPAFALTLSVAGSARADVPPPQACETGSAGSACMNAGTDADEDGTCQESTCSSLDYDCDGGSNGPCGTKMSPCLLCEVAGSSGSGSSSAANSSAANSSVASTSAVASQQGGSSSAACAALTACCPSLPSSFQASCKETASTGTYTGCTEALQSFTESGYCAGQGGSGNGSATTTLAGSGKAVTPTSSSGCMTSPGTSTALDGVLFAGIAGLVLGASRRKKRA